MLPNNYDEILDRKAKFAHIPVDTDRPVNPQKHSLLTLAAMLAGNIDSEIFYQNSQHGACSLQHTPMGSLLQ
jgi:hypothetical protein